MFSSNQCSLKGASPIQNSRQAKTVEKAFMQKGILDTSLPSHDNLKWFTKKRKFPTTRETEQSSNGTSKQKKVEIASEADVHAVVNSSSSSPTSSPSNIANDNDDIFVYDFSLQNITKRETNFNTSPIFLSPLKAPFTPLNKGKESSIQSSVACVANGTEVSHFSGENVTANMPCINNPKKLIPRRLFSEIEAAPSDTLASSPDVKKENSDTCTHNDIDTERKTQCGAQPSENSDSYLTQENAEFMLRSATKRQQCELSVKRRQSAVVRLSLPVAQRHNFRSNFDDSHKSEQPNLRSHVSSILHALEIKNSHDDIENISEEDETTSSLLKVNTSELVQSINRKAQPKQKPSASDVSPMLLTLVEHKSGQILASGGSELSAETTQINPTTLDTNYVDREKIAVKTVLLNEEIDTSPQIISHHYRPKAIPIPSIASTLLLPSSNSQAKAIVDSIEESDSELDPRDVPARAENGEVVNNNDEIQLSGEDVWNDDTTMNTPSGDSQSPRNINYKFLVDDDEDDSNINEVESIDENSLDDLNISFPFFEEGKKPGHCGSESGISAEHCASSYASILCHSPLKEKLNLPVPREGFASETFLNKLSAGGKHTQFLPSDMITSRNGFPSRLVPGGLADKMLRVVEVERLKKKNSLLQIKNKTAPCQVHSNIMLPFSEEQPISVYVDSRQDQFCFVIAFCRILTLQTLLQPPYVHVIFKRDKEVDESHEFSSIIPGTSYMIYPPWYEVIGPNSTCRIIFASLYDVIPTPSELPPYVPPPQVVPSTSSVKLEITDYKQKYSSPFFSVRSSVTFVGVVQRVLWFSSSYWSFANLKRENGLTSATSDPQQSCSNLGMATMSELAIDFAVSSTSNSRNNLEKILEEVFSQKMTQLYITYPRNGHLHNAPVKTLFESEPPAILLVQTPTSLVEVVIPAILTSEWSYLATNGIGKVFLFKTIQLLKKRTSGYRVKPKPCFVSSSQRSTSNNILSFPESPSFQNEQMVIENVKPSSASTMNNDLCDKEPLVTLLVTAGSSFLELNEQTTQHNEDWHQLVKLKEDTIKLFRAPQLQGISSVLSQLTTKSATSSADFQRLSIIGKVCSISQTVVSRRSRWVITLADLNISEPSSSNCLQVEVEGHWQYLLRKCCIIEGMHIALVDVQMAGSRVVVDNKASLLRADLCKGFSQEIPQHL